MIGTRRTVIRLEDDEDSYHTIVTSIVQRNRLLNRDAIEAVERTQRFINSIGGFDALARMQRSSLEAAEQNRLNRFVTESQNNELAAWLKQIGGLEALERLRQDEKLEGTLRNQGPLFFDLINLVDMKDDSSKQRWRKINRFVFYFGAKLSDPKANKALRAIARQRKTTVRTLLEEVYFPAALVDVLARKDVRQTIRLGAKWIKTARGRVKPKRPSSLFWYQFFLWIRKEVYNEIEKKLLEKVTKQDATENLVDGGFYEREETWQSPKKSSIADEQTFRNHWRENFFGSSENDLDILKASDRISLKSLLRSNANLTRREKEILKILGKTGLNTPARLIAHKMRIAESTARVFKRNLLRKFPLLSAI